MLTQHQKEAAVKLRETGVQLYRHGWKTLMFYYSGSGDSCDQLEFMLENEEEITALTRIPAKNLPANFDESQLAQNFLELLPAGFENNEGGSGEITMDTATGQINVAHNEYYTETNSCSWEVP